MDPASACFAAMFAGGAPRTFTDTEIKAEIDKQQAVASRVVRGTAVPPALIEHLRTSGVTLVARREYSGSDVMEWLSSSLPCHPLAR